MLFQVSKSMQQYILSSEVQWSNSK